MHELFDKQLSRKIASTFNNHEEPMLPSDWDNMKAKLQKRKKGRTIGFFLPLWAKAASVSLLIGLGTIISLNYNSPETNGNCVAQCSNIESGRKISGTNSDNNLPETTLFKTPENNTSFYETKNMVAYSEMNKNQNNQSNSIVRDSVTGKQTIEMATAGIEGISELKRVTPNQDLAVINTNEYRESVPENQKENRFNIGIGVSTLNNYTSTGVSDYVNYGGSVFSEYKLTSHISINSGVMIARQSFNYENDKNNVEYLKAATPVADGEFVNAQSLIASSSIELIGIDIPVNLKFNVNDFFIKTGVSSLAYFKEKHSVDVSGYTQNAVLASNGNTYNMETNFVKDQKTEKNTDVTRRFDFARLFNLSLGYHFKLKKGSITAEPYLKIPIGSLTTEEIKFGSGGLTLAYQFPI